MDDRLLGIKEIRELFHLGRTAAYQLTRRPEFPEPVAVSPRCYRWWASEVIAFTATLRGGAIRRPRTPSRRSFTPDTPTAQRRITGTVRAARHGKDAS